MADISIYWFRDDLRLSDLPGLAAAASAGPVVPVFVRDSKLGGDWSMASASQWWLHHSLVALQHGLAENGLELVLRSGSTVDVLTALAKEVRATTVYCSRHYQPWSASLEQTLKDKLSETDVTLKRYPGTLLHEPENVATGGASQCSSALRQLSQSNKRRALRLGADSDRPQLGLWLERPVAPWRNRRSSGTR